MKKILRAATYKWRKSNKISFKILTKEIMKHFAKLGDLNMRHCAFCKYWYDPANSAITPIRGRKGMWEYDGEEKRCCLKWSNSERKAYNICKFFECKM